MNFDQYSEHHQNIFDTLVMPQLAAMLNVTPASYTYEPLANRRISGASALWRGADGTALRVAIGERQTVPPAAYTLRYHNQWAQPSEWDYLLADPAYRGDDYVQAYVDGNQLNAIGIVDSSLLVRAISSAMAQYKDFRKIVASLCDGKNNFLPGEAVLIAPGVSLATTLDTKFMFFEVDWEWLNASGVEVQVWTQAGTALAHRLAPPDAGYVPPSWLADAIRGTVATTCKISGEER